MAPLSEQKEPVNFKEIFMMGPKYMGEGGGYVMNYLDNILLDEVSQLTTWVCMNISDIIAAVASAHVQGLCIWYSFSK